MTQQTTTKTPEAKGKTQIDNSAYCIIVDKSICMTNYTRILQRDNDSSEHIILVHHNDIDKLIDILSEYKTKAEM